MAWKALWASFEDRLASVETKVADAFKSEATKLREEIPAIVAAEVSAEVAKLQVGLEDGLTALRNEYTSAIAKLSTPAPAPVVLEPATVTLHPIVTVEGA